MANTSTYKGIYGMHKYWGKKPFNEISKFIEKYSQKDDVVMDCFCGSGVTLIEALKADRKAVGIDLNPIAIKLAKVSVTPVDIEELKLTYNNIKKKLQKKIYSLYEMQYAGEQTMVTHTIWKNGEPIEVWYRTQQERKKIRTGTKTDIWMCNEPQIEPKWYPKTDLYENTRINVGKDQKVSDLFTPRALVGLSLLLEEIKQIDDEKIRNIFELTLSGTLSQASKLVFVIRRKKNNGDIAKAEVGSWVVGYWVPEEHFEINVWNCFENRFKRILKGEQEIFEMFSDKSEEYFRSYFCLYRGTATKIPIEDNSIDYVFIDPPHGNRIPYMEQSLMWNAWLGMENEIEWEEEIVVTEAAKRKDKDIKDYQERMDTTFSEISRVLKPNKYFSMAFNCLDDKMWIDILNLFISNGFEIREIEPLEYSATSVMQDNRKNALKTDFVLTFQNSGTVNLEQIVFRDDGKELENIIRSLLMENALYEVYNIINILFAKTIPKGYIYRVSQIIKCCETLMKKTS